MKPLRDEVIIKAVKQEVQTASGIVLPDAIPPKQTTGTVIAVGKDVKEVKLNNNVLFGEDSYYAISINENDVLFIKELNILAILD
jgi:chaperonin GroES